jgi:bifunctional non-homologous end joining protein LigD
VSGFIPVALATLDTQVPSGDAWVHEEKLDGYRIEAVVVNSGRTPSVRLFSRNAKDWTHRFPDIARALAALPVASAVFDGEVVAAGAAGASAFQALQRSLEEGTAQRLRYHVFDLLQVDGTDLRREPLAERQALLREILRYRAPRAPVRLVRRLSPRRGDPIALACAAGLEGVVSKRLDAPYLSGRHRHWLKIKCARRQEFVIVGFTEPRGTRRGFGALLLGVYDRAGALHFSGKVGTGFDTVGLVALHKQLVALETSRPAVQSAATLPRGDVHWVRPELVAEVSFTEWTADGVLRHPVFRGLRADKPAREVRREEPA